MPGGKRTDALSKTLDKRRGGGRDHLLEGAKTSPVKEEKRGLEIGYA